MHSNPLFNLGKHNQTEPPGTVEPTRISCGFEDIEDPVDIETRTESHGPLYRFRHHSQLRMLTRLYKELQGSGEDVILQFHDVTVYRSDLGNLREDEWLNDNNISFLYEYLERVYMKDKPNKDAIVLLRPSMAYLLLHTEDDPALLKPVLPSFENAQFVFLPINDNPDVTQIEGGMHWSLLVVCLGLRKAFYYDTMHESNYGASKKTARKLSALLGYELEFVSLPTPRQVTMSDCGVLVCELTALLVNRLLSEDTSGNVDLKVEDVGLIASAGRTFMLTSILQLVSERSGNGSAFESD